MDFTYYLIYKKYKGIWTRKHLGNNSFIVTTISNSQEGIVFVPMGYYQDSSNVLLWTKGLYSVPSQEIVDTTMNESRFYQLLEKIPSKAIKRVDSSIKEISIDKWISPLKIDIVLQHSGEYLQSTIIKTMLYKHEPEGNMIFIAKMDFKPELDDIEEPAVKMTAYKTKALYNSIMRS